MKLKYYLRGLGIGIVVTAIIMGIALGGTTKETLSNEEIKQRAVEMGMVEGKYLSDIQKITSTGEEQNTTEEEPSTEEPSTEEPSSEEPSTEEPSTEEPSTEEPSSEEPSTEEPSSEEPSSEEPSSEEPISEEPSIEAPSVEDGNTSIQDGDLVSIVISRGDSSWSVSKDLEAAGLITDAKAYDEYLCGNGYDKSLHVGSYEIAKGLSNEEIAKIITKKR